MQEHIKKCLAHIISKNFNQLDENLYFFEKYMSLDDKNEFYLLAALNEYQATEAFLEAEASYGLYKNSRLQKYKNLEKLKIQMEATSFLTNAIGSWYQDHSLRGNIRFLNTNVKNFDSKNQ